MGLEMKYFVLKPKGKDVYAKASRMAMLEYAKVIQDENRRLYDELQEWAVREHLETLERGTDKPECR
jgi:hypothetical protein